MTDRIYVIMDYACQRGAPAIRRWSPEGLPPGYPSTYIDDVDR
jgi:hypothetical protein